MIQLKNYKPSRYNLFFQYNGIYYAYNSFSNALASVEYDYYKLLAKMKINHIPENLEKISDDLIKGNFVVKKELDEINRISVIYESRKWSSVLGLTIAPTLLCNCKCEYCFQSKESQTMKTKTYIEIINYIVAQSKEVKKINITWYGGEPMLEMRNIIYFYQNLSSKIEKNKLSTSIITNGTVVDEKFLTELQKYSPIEMIQVTFDGKKEIHNSKRFLHSSKGTYDMIIKNLQLLIRILKKTKIMIRINIDKSSLSGIEELVIDLKNKLAPQNNLSIYFGHLRKYTINVKTKNEEFLTSSEFETEEISLIQMLNEIGFKAYLYPSSFPSCMIDHHNSFVIDPNGDVFKCWDLIGNKRFNMGNIDNMNAVLNSALYYQLMSNNPVQTSKCKNCIALPICLGKCAVVRLGYSSVIKEENDCFNIKHILIEQLKYKINNREV